MNEHNSIFVIIAFGLLAGLFAMLSILLGGGNEIATFYAYLLVALFTFGFLVPRTAFAFWLVFCGYTDLLKRFLVVTGRVSFWDLYYVLGIPPVMLGAITLSVLVGAASGRFQLRKFHWMLFALACTIIVAVAGLAAKDSGNFAQSVLPAITNSGLYFILIFLVPALFKTTDDVLKMLRLLLWAYLPVALYGVFQQIYGYREFEIDYLKSGLSIEIKQLVSDEVRAFSTLNSTTSLATVSAALFSVSLLLPLMPSDGTRRRVLGWIPALLMAVAYLGGLLASTGRAAVSVIAFSILGWLCFRSKKRIIAAYLCCGIGFTALVFSADSLLANLNLLQDEVSTATGGGQGYLMQMTRVGTYSDRLRGFSNLVTSPDVWTLFGHKAVDVDEKTLFSHDILTNSLVQYGAVPVGVALLLLLIGVAKAHGGVLGIQDRLRRSLSSGLLALTLSFVVLSLLAGNVLVIFPINVFACLFCGMMLVIFQHDWAERSVPEVVTRSLVPSRVVENSRRVIHRFSRSGRVAW